MGGEKDAAGDDAGAISSSKAPVFGSPVVCPPLLVFCRSVDIVHAMLSAVADLSNNVLLIGRFCSNPLRVDVDGRIAQCLSRQSSHSLWSSIVLYRGISSDIR